MAESFDTTANNVPPAATGLKVMLVEDDANDVELLRLAFKSVPSPQLDVAFNGREAIEAIQARAEEQCWPDMILCDLNMPVMNGFEFIKWLKAESPCPRTPLIVVPFTASGRIRVTFPVPGNWTTPGVRA